MKDVNREKKIRKNLPSTERADAVSKSQFPVKTKWCFPIFKKLYETVAFHYFFFDRICSEIPTNKIH